MAVTLRPTPVLLLAEIDRRLGICERLARCIEDLRAPKRIHHTLAAMVDLFCDSFATVPRRIVPDIDDIEDPVHGAQQLRCSTPTMMGAAPRRARHPHPLAARRYPGARGQPLRPPRGAKTPMNEPGWRRRFGY